MPSTSNIRESARDIQGNLIGFNKDHQFLLFVMFPTAESGQSFLRQLIPEISDAESVLNFNRSYRDNVIEDKKDPAQFQGSWTNVVLSFQGLQTILAPGLDSFPATFVAGMRAGAQRIGDQGISDPTQWDKPFDGSAPVHAAVIMAADEPADLNTLVTKVRGFVTASGAGEVGFQAGDARTAKMGHEHFGFKDGISQPGIFGWTTSSKGGDQIKPGEFVIGYPDQDGAISGSVTTAPAPLQTGDPGYPGTAPATPGGLPEWAENGSFVVYRKLQQDVAGFRKFTEEQAVHESTTPERLGAKLIGRWKKGAPLERVADVTYTADPADVDPTETSSPDINFPQHINNFDYQGDDSDGHATPCAAHIRKSYPRDQTPPGEDESERHRIIRRGIPYGPELASTESPYGQVVPPNQDRGLLFVCYQADIDRGFEFIQRSWVNDPNFPQPGDGLDPIISQQSEGQAFTVNQDTHVTLRNWVRTRGGEYFFAPWISAIEMLANP